ncbi:MAG: terminase small subunit [Clostridia bacterium]|nr:terminase small subunit [Clostridia bacterium]
MKQTQLERNIEAYFSSCDATRERITKKSGEVVEWQQPYTLFGLCAATGLSVEQVYAFRDGQGKPKKNCAAIQRALFRIAAYILEHALTGELNWQVAIASIKDMGLVPEGESFESGMLTITMDDASTEAGI